MTVQDKLHRVIGIDLGTTYSAVAAWDTFNEQAEIIPNRAEGDLKSTPSVIGLDPIRAKVIVGNAAKQNIHHDPENTIIEVKREMGETFTEETLARFNAGRDYSKDQLIRLRFADQWMLPQELSAFVLMKMKEIAEKEIGTTINDAVITVPAYFTENQKKATRDAALMAGLYPRQLIPEPTAAAICYGLDKMDAQRRVYLVYDLGGGTFDVSIIDVKGDEVSVIATSGDPRLGGGDFDDAITTWALECLLRDFQIDLRNDPVARARIKAHAEKSKIILSTVQQVDMALVDISPQTAQLAPTLTLTREKLEELILPQLKKSLSYVEDAVRLAGDKGVLREHIDAILLVGGSSQLPLVKTLLLDYFGKDESFVRGELDPAAVVARGAAILAYRFQPTPGVFDIHQQSQATLLNPDAEDFVGDVNLITEHSLGIGVNRDEVAKIIKVGSNIPIKVTDTGYTNAGATTEIPVRIYQGEGANTWENTLIGSFMIKDLDPPTPRYHQFNVTFGLDENGLLSAEVHEIRTDKKWSAEFESEAGVEGDTALAVMHKKLLQMYAHTTATGASPVPPQSPTPVRDGFGGSAPTTGGQVYQPPPPSNTAQPPVGAPVQPGGQVYQPPPPTGQAQPPSVAPPVQQGAPTSQPPQPAGQPQGTPAAPTAARPPQPAPVVYAPPTPTAQPQTPPPQAPAVSMAQPAPAAAQPPQPATSPQGAQPPVAGPAQPVTPQHQPTAAQPQATPAQPPLAGPAQPAAHQQQVPPQIAQPVTAQVQPTPQVAPQPTTAPPPTPAPPAAAPAAAQPAGVPGLIAPTAEVPAQFKQVVRRANKLLLKKSAPELLEAFNAFTTALNAGTPEDDLLDVGDDLADAYDDARG